jgi:hypothetical protein
MLDFDNFDCYMKIRNYRNVNPDSCEARPDAIAAMTSLSSEVHA